eukprot:EC783845.1.p1 GENE.EC783845.1~~EC783845.1.p1  ORF type:complete len:66 (-),score=21.73 EC783845.1:106-303(-)
MEVDARSPPGSSAGHSGSSDAPSSFDLESLLRRISALQNDLVVRRHGRGGEMLHADDDDFADLDY